MSNVHVFDYDRQTIEVEIKGKSYELETGNFTIYAAIADYAERMQARADSIDKDGLAAMQKMADEGRILMTRIFGEESANAIIKGDELNVIFIVKLLQFVGQLIVEEENVSAMMDQVTELADTDDRDDR